MNPVLLDMFCGAGGAAMGYSRAGFDIVGVDIKPQKNYPFRFIQADALEYASLFAQRFDVIHASPPCQAYSVMKHLSNGTHPELVEQCRELMQATGLTWVMENVPGSPLIDPVVLCGSSFGLDLRRHRLFESNIDLVGKPCDHSWQTPRFNSTASRNGPKNGLSSVVTVCGNRTTPFRNQKSGVLTIVSHDRQGAGISEWRRAMEIDWMTRDELSQAIPPAYTQWLGRQLFAFVTGSEFRDDPE